MERKFVAPCHLKALTDDEEPGTFEAIVAVFGNVDRYGDRVEVGAFDNSLKKGFPPIVWSHMWSQPPIGVPLEAKAVDEGLYIKGRLFIEENKNAAEVYAAMKSLGGDGRSALREFSFAYDIVKAAWIVEDEEEIYSLQELDLIEVGPCLKGVNPETRLISVKGAEPATGIPVDEDGRRVKEEQTTDNPSPNSAKADEEGAARTRALALARPRHSESKES